MAEEKQKLKFKRPKILVLTVVDGEKKEVGSIRVEPSAVSWKPAGGARWHKLSIKEFGNLAIQNGSVGEE